VGAKPVGILEMTTSGVLTIKEIICHKRSLIVAVNIFLGGFSYEEANF
jgi:hypothetical protein